MKRRFLFGWYETPRGRILQDLETRFLQHAIQVSCRQAILQIGGLGWENDFIDCSLYEKFIVLDDKALACPEALKIQAKAYSLPIQTASVDLVILPHMLEFDAQRFQTMREVERILKPEGEILIINFNPWNIWVRYQFLLDIKWSDSWHAHFIGCSRVLDWLKLLNFQVKSTCDLSVKQLEKQAHHHGRNLNPMLSMAYGVRAIKRRYTLIPLAPKIVPRPRLVVVDNLETSQQNNEHG